MLVSGRVGRVSLPTKHACCPHRVLGHATPTRRTAREQQGQGTTLKTKKVRQGTKAKDHKDKTTETPRKTRFRHERQQQHAQAKGVATVHERKEPNRQHHTTRKQLPLHKTGPSGPVRALIGNSVLCVLGSALSLCCALLLSFASSFALLPLCPVPFLCSARLCFFLLPPLLLSLRFCSALLCSFLLFCSAAPSFFFRAASLGCRSLVCWFDPLCVPLVCGACVWWMRWLPHIGECAAAHNG